MTKILRIRRFPKNRKSKFRPRTRLEETKKSKLKMKFKIIKLIEIEIN